MTYEEAIREIEWLKERGFVADRGIVGAERIVEACNMAIEALEKQIPKKPIKSYSCKCPCCGNEVFSYDVQKQQFCSECGQAIDWSES